MQQLILAWLAFTATAPYPCPNGTVPGERAPQGIVLILADDLGYGDLGCYRSTPSPLATPNLDRMAAEGMLFRRHYAGATVCAPSRAVLMTGLHGGHAPIRTNGGGGLEAGQLTLPGQLKVAGYTTACFGKYGVGRDIAPGDPGRAGFAEFFGYLDMSHAHNFYPHFLYRNEARVELPNVLEDPWPGKRGQGVASKRVSYAPELFQEEALQFLRRNRNERFFLFLSLNVPHANNEAGRSSRPEKGMEVPDLGPFADEDWPGPERGFAEMMRRIDRDVGQLLDLLDELELAKNTLVLFTSDNGPHSEGGHRADYFDSAGGLRGKKRDLYEGGIRVPLIARWPGQVAAGSVSEHVCGFQDFLPTLAELSGAPMATEIDGISFAPTLRGRAEDQEQHPFLYWEFYEQGGKRALVQGSRWKIVQRQLSRAEPLAPELYDLLEDPGETTDLAAGQADRVALLLQLMDEAHTPLPGTRLFSESR